MSLDANKAVIRRYFEEIMNGGNVSLVDELVAEDFVDHDAPGGLMLGREGVRQTIAALHKGFNPFHTEIVDLIAEGDKVVMQGVWRVVHVGEFMGVPPSGKAVTIWGIAIWRVVNGKIVERWGTIDRSELLPDPSVSVTPPRGPSHWSKKSLNTSG